MWYALTALAAMAIGLVIGLMTRRQRTTSVETDILHYHTPAPPVAEAVKCSHCRTDLRIDGRGLCRNCGAPSPIRPQQEPTPLAYPVLPEPIPDYAVSAALGTGLGIMLGYFMYKHYRL